MTKYSAFGTALVKGGDEIANVRNISGPALSLDVVDVTTHDSTDAWEEVVATILRTGQVTLELVFDAGDLSHIDLLGGLVGKEFDDFEIWFPDDDFTSFQFVAFVVGFNPSTPHDGAITASLALKVTGVPVLDGSFSP